MKKSKNWVDYKAVKAKVSLKAVLDKYGVELKPSGKSLVSKCPIHGGSNSRQFSVNVERNIWKCFGDCGAGGNVIDFVAQMEKVSIHQAGLLLQEWFSLGSGPEAEEKSQPQESGEETKTDEAPLEDEGQADEEPEAVNPPLKFKLSSLDPDHPYFQENGLEPETVKEFGLGFCSRGLMKGRIAIPIHDHKDQIVAYCGRAISEEQEKKEGKYKMPRHFVKSAVIYNLNRQEKTATGLIVVESFLSVFKLYQAGILNAVALMGSSLSQEQEDLLVGHVGAKGHVLLMLDADESGQRCTQESLERLSKRVYVKAVDISHWGKKPHNLKKEELIKAVLGQG